MPNQKDTGQSALNAGVAGIAPLPVGTNSTSAKNEVVTFSASHAALDTTSAGTVGNKDRHTDLKPNPEWYNGIDALPGHENPPKANLPWPREGSISYGTNLARSAHKGENPRHADGGKPLTQTRPAKFDKVAYMAKYMAMYRAEVKSGKRVPKRKGE